jgi:pimeloyl-ACP methyl ester carboxylesterase
VVVGWSIGGILALELAERLPELVRALVLLEPPWLAKHHPTLRMLGGILGGKLRGALGNPAAGGERFLRWALARRDGRCELDDLPPEARQRVRAAGRAMLAELDGGTGEHLAATLRPLPMPVTLLTGDQSTPEFAAAATRLGALLGITPEIIAGAGHLLQQTHAQAVASAVRRLAAGERFTVERGSRAPL